MRTQQTISGAFLLLATAFVVPAAAQDKVHVATDACVTAGKKLAEQRNATLVASKNNDGVCEVVLLIPSSDGSRPRREVVEVKP